MAWEVEAVNIDNEAYNRVGGVFVKGIPRWLEDWFCRFYLVSKSSPTPLPAHTFPGSAPLDHVCSLEISKGDLEINCLLQRVSVFLSKARVNSRD